MKSKATVMTLYHELLNILFQIISYASPFTSLTIDIDIYHKTKYK